MSLITRPVLAAAVLSALILTVGCDDGAGADQEVATAALNGTVTLDTLTPTIDVYVSFEIDTTAAWQAGSEPMIQMPAEPWAPHIDGILSLTADLQDDGPDGPVDIGSVPGVTVALVPWDIDAIVPDQESHVAQGPMNDVLDPFAACDTGAPTCTAVFAIRVQANPDIFDAPLTIDWQLDANLFGADDDAEDDAVTVALSLAQ